MSYGFFVKVSDDIQLDLINKINIPTSPVIHYDKIDEQDVAKHFVEMIVEVTRKIKQLLKKYITVIMNDIKNNEFHKVLEIIVLQTLCSCENCFYNVF